MKRSSGLLALLAAAVFFLFGCGAEEPEPEVVVPPAPEETEQGFGVLFVSDSHIRGDVASGVFPSVLRLGMAAEHDIRFVLHGGDITDDATDEAAWQEFETLRETLDGVMLYPAWGNHDDGLAQGKYFDIERNGPPDMAKQFYSFDYENAHFIMMDSSYMGLQNDAYVQWLRDDVAAAGQQWNILVMHHPLYPATDSEKDLMRAEAQRALWLDAIEESGVDLVLCGHQHVYMHSKSLRQGVEDAGGVTYVMVSSGGEEPEHALADYDYIAAARDDISSYCVLRIGETKLDITAYDQTGAEIDAFTLE